MTEATASRPLSEAGGQASPSLVLETLVERHRSPEGRAYLRVHARRYELLAHLASSILESPAESSAAVRVLDVGPAYESDLLRMLAPDAAIDTLGFLDDRFASQERGRHIEFDLNDSEFESRWPAAQEYDLIVLAEVLEHLHVSTAHVLAFLSTLMKPEGSLLLQTPNAARLRNRLELLSGRNPFELIRPDRWNPGHFREYTLSELETLAEDAGLRPVKVILANYFDTGTRSNRLASRLEPVMPGTLRAGITMWLVRSADR